MSRIFTTAVTTLAMFGTQALAKDLPWRLADYPSGGRALTGMVAASLTRQGDLIGPTCAALKPGSAEQIASGVSGIAVAISDSEGDNAATIVDGIPECCQALISSDADARITLGVAIALETRSLAETDLRPAQGAEMIVSICEDDVLQRSYELARGQDNLGQLIAQEGGVRCAGSGTADRPRDGWRRIGIDQLTSSSPGASRRSDLTPETGRPPCSASMTGQSTLTGTGSTASSGQPFCCQPSVPSGNQ